MAFDLNNYEPVEARIKRFWEQYPNGRIHTEIVERTEKDIIIRCDVYRDLTDLVPASVDFAHEVIGSTNINRTNWLENATTSAIGRGLATLGFSPKGARPSREETAKVARVAAFDGGKAGRITLDDVNVGKEALTGFIVAILETRSRAGLQQFYRWARDNKANETSLSIIEEAGKSFSPGQPMTGALDNQAAPTPQEQA